MSLLKVDTIQGRSGTDISVASGHTLKDASGNAFGHDIELFIYLLLSLTSSLNSVPACKLYKQKCTYI